jgi:hypothetical protein
MKNLKVSLLFIAVLMLTVVSCNQPYYHIPTDANGDPIITQLSTTAVTPDPVTTNDTKFTVTAKLPNAHKGDKMFAELLDLQVPSSGGSKQMLPIKGTKKNVTVGDDLNVTVTYTTQEAKLKNPGDEVLVVFGGPNDSAQMKITLEQGK